MIAQLDACTDRMLRLQAVLEAGARSASRLLAITLPAPLARPAHVFELQATQPAYYFGTGDETGDVGLGSVITLVPHNTSNLEAAAVDAQHWLDRASEVGIDVNAKAPRFVGGITYDAASTPSGHWNAFPQFQFDLPRFRYLTDGRHASLTLHVLTSELEQAISCGAWVASTEALLSAIGQRTNFAPMPRIRTRADSPSAKDWMGGVERALMAMERGALEKVVLAREVTLEFDSTPSIGRILENLSALSPETTRFAFRKAGGTFLGATPERLVFRLGSEIRTEAVAGSIRALDPDAAEFLLGSAKERHEHELVVRELVRKFVQLGAKPELPARPAIRQLRHVLHLATPITARLFGAPHVLSLVAKLHPTPAVGGVPEQAARDLMRIEERFERGWYAAPLGWFDAQGDGEFVVGLRSGLLTGRQLRLYAGAGIVRDSRPDTEFRETELKLQGLLEAIGAHDNPFTVLATPDPSPDVL